MNSRITEYLDATRRGEPGANEQLFALVYDTLRQIAASRLGRESGSVELQATELVHEAWLRLGGGATADWQNRFHFFAAAAEAMRRTLVDNARRKLSAKRGGPSLTRHELFGHATTTPLAQEVLDLNEALEDFERIEPVKAQVVKLKFFAGMTIDEIAHTLNLSNASVERYWAYARAWLFSRLGEQASNQFDS